MRILFFITGLEKSGAETQMYNLISQLSKKKSIEIKVISLTGGYYLKKLKNLGISISVCSNSLSYNLFKYISFFIREVKDFKPEIVHSFLFHTNIVSKLSLFSLKKDFKLICSYRDKISNHKLIYYLEKINSSRADYLISNSYEADQDLKFSSTKRAVINNGVNFKKANSSKVKELKKKYKGKKIILTIGRFAHQKDYVTNVDTVYELSKLRDDFLFLYVGKGELRAEIEQRVREYGLSKYVKFLGFRDDIAELMSVADVFFLPTLHESQSNVFIEAMSFKLPIVTTEIPENKALIRQGVFCSIGDYKKMSDEIDKIFSNGFDDKLLEENYNYVCNEFSLLRMSKNYYKIYEDLLK